MKGVFGHELVLEDELVFEEELLDSKVIQSLRVVNTPLQVAMARLQKSVAFTVKDCPARLKEGGKVKIIWRILAVQFSNKMVSV
jgi:hypothetical protein